MKIGTVVMAAVILVGSPCVRSDACRPRRRLKGQRAPARSACPSALQRSNAAPGSAATDKVDPAKDAAIRHLMDLTQSSKMGEDFNRYVTNQVHEVLSSGASARALVEAGWHTFSEKMATAIPPTAINDAAVPIYAEAFSMEDIQGLVQFYESPLGQRVVKALPQVAQQSQRVGMQMEQKSAMTVLQDMSYDYPDLKQLLRGQEGNGSGEKRAAPGPAPAPAPAA